MIKARYIWTDGTKPTAQLRSKTKVVPDGTTTFPQWNFDGSSTNQAAGGNSDCILEPVFVCPDPIRGGTAVIVLCEVYSPDGTPHASNNRAALREVAARHEAEEAWYGIEQEYTMFRHGRPLGWPKNGYPAPQGPFYCGVGADECYGRPLVEDHLDACIAAGLGISGTNAEVMPGQWEYQIGPCGPLEVGDHLLVSRWLMYELGEKHDISVTLDPKPVRGDWNGAGAHTNFSTKAMRAEGGIEVIKAACEKLGKNVAAHVAAYGDRLEERLTGLHETQSINQFSYGISDRGASIRIPSNVAAAGKGYLEDRRPNANIDPYTVARLMLSTCCD
jgi:glutamine synthetase